MGRQCPLISVFVLCLVYTSNAIMVGSRSENNVKPELLFKTFSFSLMLLQALPLKAGENREKNR